MSPKELVKKWVSAFNDGDVDQIISFYADEAINHQVPNQPVEGKEAIHQMFSTEFAHAEMHCIVENIFEDGEWVILEWKDPTSLRGCGFFHIQNNKIVFQRGYWDKLSFLRLNHLPIPTE